MQPPPPFVVTYYLPTNRWVMVSISKVKPSQIQHLKMVINFIYFLVIIHNHYQVIGLPHSGSSSPSSAGCPYQTKPSGLLTSASTDSCGASVMGGTCSRYMQLFNMVIY